VRTSFQTLLNQSWVLRLICGLAVCAVLLALEGLQREAPPPPAQAVWPVNARAAANSKLVLVAQGKIPMPVNIASAHASTLLAMPPAHPSALMAFWFAGSREGASDVQIAASQFDRVTQRWSEARFVVNRHEMGEQLGHGVRRLGNPVAWLDAQNKVHLFVVATGWGGWSAGRILHLRQSGDAQDVRQLSFEPARVMPLSWLWNTSFLVRSAPLPLADGGMVLPVYFELGIKYPMLLRFDGLGHFKGMVLISRRRYLLQPTLLMRSASHWLAFMRDNRGGGNVAVAETTNGGLDWVDATDLSILNHDTSVVGMALGPDRMLLAHNSSPNSRSVLDLSSSNDGRIWQLERTLAGAGAANKDKEGEGAGSEFSYPSLAWADDSVWVSYTDQRRRIAWQRFRYDTVPPRAGLVSPGQSH
jgi:predicted neuraminidase